MIWLIPVDCRRSPHEREQFLRFQTAEFLVLPLLLTQRNRCEEVERLANAAAVPRSKIPQINSQFFAQGSKQHQAIKIADAVAPGLGARQLQWLAPVRLDLSCDSFLAGGPQDLPRQIIFADEQGERDDLQIVVGSMIVFRGGFVATVLAFEHPLKKFSKPILQARLITRGQRFRTREQTSRATDLSHPAGLTKA